MENRDNSLKTGLYIRDILLKNSDELMTKISFKKIFGLRAHSDTTFPYIVYARTSAVPTYTKTQCPTGLTRVTMTYNVVDNDYERGCDIANALRHSIEYKAVRIENDILIRDIELVSSTETTVEDAFVQTLTFITDVS